MRRTTLLKGIVLAGAMALATTPPGLAGQKPREVCTGQGGTGAAHTCFVAGDGSVRCWGLNIFGQLGDGTFSLLDADGVEVLDTTGQLLTGVAKVALGWLHSCVLQQTGEVSCWGWNLFGQLGDSTFTDRGLARRVTTDGTPTGPGLQAVQLASTAAHSCAVTADSQVFCWGYNHFGQLGDGTWNRGTLEDCIAGICGKALPVQVVTAAGPLADVTQVGLGWASSCARTRAGGAWCWGLDITKHADSAADWDIHSENFPTAVQMKDTNGTPIDGVTDLVMGADHVCVQRFNQKVYCWGYNGHGQILPGGPTYVTTPTEVLAHGVPTVTSLSAGNNYTCARTSNKRVWCWGENAQGQLGVGTQDPQPGPVEVRTAEGAVFEDAFDLTRGVGDHQCLRDRDGVPWCWGSNDVGQLGAGLGLQSFVPIRATAMSCGE